MAKEGGGTDGEGGTSIVLLFDRLGFSFVRAYFFYILRFVRMIRYRPRLSTRHVYAGGTNIYDEVNSILAFRNRKEVKKGKS